MIDPPSAGDHGSEADYRGGRKFWRDRAKGQCIDALVRDGWRVYTRGFPTIVAEKGNFMRLIVVNPRVTLGRGAWLGKGKDALSKVFLKCFGVKYEVWGQPDAVPKEDDFV